MLALREEEAQRKKETERRMAHALSKHELHNLIDEWNRENDQHSMLLT